jgi:flavin reductase (DIM6/NTAB) family NADH-FMN oxidoreductase RutF/DNA-binding IclR family transcriptional regulator
MPDPHDPRWFRQVLGQYPTGVCVVTTIEADGTPNGFVVGSFTSVSLDPPLVAFFPDKGSTSWPKIEATKKFCVNILGADGEDLCRKFAAKGADRFDGVEWRPSPVTATPILAGVVAWIDCELGEVTEAGDHFIVLGEVRDLDIEESSLPLLFFQGGYGRFAPLTLTASDRGGMLTEQLREFDLVRSTLGELAADLSARCIASAPSEDALAVIASAGGTNTASAATLVGQRLPFTPPTGSVFAAWLDDAGRAEYLAGLDEAGRADQEARLAAVRDRGYSVGLINEAQRRFAGVIDRLAIDPDAHSHDEVRELIDDLAYDPVELSEREKEQIRSITVPVFGPQGEVAFAFTLYGFPKPRPDGGVDVYIERALEAARAAGERLSGPSTAARDAR